MYASKLVHSYVRKAHASWLRYTQDMQAHEHSTRTHLDGGSLLRRRRDGGNLYVYMYVCMFLCAYSQIHIHTYTHDGEQSLTYMHVCVLVGCTPVCMSAGLYVSMYASLWDV